jgi:hypothetical protein
MAVVETRLIQDAAVIIVGADAIRVGADLAQNALLVFGETAVRRQSFNPDP